jgi:transposase-like protein
MRKADKKLEIGRTRHFSEEFKKAKVRELVDRQITVSELSRLYGVTRTAVYKWLYKYSPNHEKKSILVVEMESESYKTKRLLEKVAELERVIGQKQLELDMLNKLLEIGSEELGFDLKKNFSTKLSNGTGSTGEPIPTK